MEKLDFEKMTLLDGGSDAIGCDGLILIGVVTAFVSFGWGLGIAAFGLGICASESQKRNEV